MASDGGTAEIDYEIYIAAAPERIWAALTDASVSRLWFFGRRIESDWGAGAALCYRMPDGGIEANGRVTEIDAPRLVRYRLSPVREGPDAASSVISFEITECGGMCRLAFSEVHAAPGSGRRMLAARRVWPVILSGLKTLLETGRPAEIDIARLFDDEA
ncbi:MAG TPA: SRPBCC domain-containing protein [Kaistia sp.]|nr:SRPBCC domain-containing protein [Kaistia sp.]